MNASSPFKSSLIAAALSLTAGLSQTSHADILGIYVGAGIWGGSLGGDIGNATVPASAEELGIDGTESNAYIFAAFEHPVPVLPNVRLAWNNIESGGDATVSRQIVIDSDLTIAADADTQTDIDLSFIDSTLYYEVLDNYVSVDVGLTARIFDGSASISYETDLESDSEQDSLDETLPMLYLKGQVDLPFTGWYAGAQGNFISYEDNSITDIEAKIGYLTSGLGLDWGFDIGYRTMAIEIDPDDASDIGADVDYSGPFANFVVHF